MNILVTGATGFLGSRLVQRLSERTHIVSVLKRQTSDTAHILSAVLLIFSFLVLLFVYVMNRRFPVHAG